MKYIKRIVMNEDNFAAKVRKGSKFHGVDFDNGIINLIFEEPDTGDFVERQFTIVADGSVVDGSVTYVGSVKRTWGYEHLFEKKGVAKKATS